MKLFDVYPLMNITPVKAQGSYLWDSIGKKYLDLYGGHAVISIGHSHPTYVKKLTEQLNQIAFYSNSVINLLQEELAIKLGELSGYSDYKLFLCNSGAEANENALKLASFHNGRKKVIAFHNSFHGRTSLAVASTDDQKINANINKTHEVIFLPLNDHDAFLKEISNEICAVIIEGIQGVGGIKEPTTEFLQLLSSETKKHDALLILDEVQSGYGRSGKFFAHQFAEISPDIITIAKGMGNGFPVAGVMIHPKIQSKYGLLGTTFGGNYLACAASLAVLEVIKKENLIQNACEIGENWIKELKQIEGVQEVRGRGLMIGLQFDFPIATIKKQLLEEFGILVGTASDPNVLRLLPALNITEKEIEIFNQALNHVLTNQLASIK
ncbi:MAG TPA: aminotransferase class III-fold pyridoxal phosphate-dependent enzyme [Bacteroidia bacterium]|nr:aminotransferase class III-fold pyridoxal phosphate-dependent enzyme [Bacteroidia bacterium]